MHVVRQPGAHFDDMESLPALHAHLPKQPGTRNGKPMTETVQQPIDAEYEEVIRKGITVLALQVHQTAVDHGWWDVDGGNRNMGEMIALMHSELSEALECDRNHEPVLWFKHEGFIGQGSVSDMPEYQGKLGKPEGIASEFADTIIRILDTCQRLDIPIAEALIRKHNFNLTRPHRHGNKAY
jgi:hypothetical protein